MFMYIGLSYNSERLWYFIVLRLEPFWSNERSIYIPGTYFSRFCGSVVNLSIANLMGCCFVIRNLSVAE